MNKIYIENLNCLRNKNNYLADKIENVIENESINIVESKIKNEYTINIKINNKNKFVHSYYNPLVHAEKVINKLNFEYYNLIGVIGIGCGHYIKEILKRINNQSKVIVFIKHLKILKKTMHFQDMTDIFSAENIEIFDTNSNKYIVEMKNKLLRLDFMSLIAGNIVVFDTPVLSEVDSEDYKTINKNFINVLKFLANNLGNAPGDTLLGIKHSFKNLRYFFQNKLNRDKLADFKGKPAICVASGPSLDKNIDILKEIQDKALIFSAGTSLHKLVNYGIEPDFFSVLERPEIVYQYTIKNLIENGDYPKNIIAFLDGVVHPKIFDNVYPNLIPVFRNTVPTEKWFADSIQGLLSLDTGLSVANLNFMIAHLLGCSPIILVGQDLAFSPDGKIHAQNTVYDELGEGDISDIDLVTLKNHKGEKLLAKKVWRSFKNWFEIKISEENIECIDATEGGAYIDGTKIMSLYEVKEKFFMSNTDNKINNSNLVKESSREVFLNNTKEFSKKLNEKLIVFNQINKRLDYILSLLNLFDKIVDLDKKTDKKFLINKYSKLNSEISLLMGMDNSFYFICQAPFVEMERYKVRKGNINIDTDKKTKKWLNYTIDKISDIKNILNNTIELYKMGKNQINEIMSKEN